MKKKVKLDNEQKKFIRQKVNELGSIDAVWDFYNGSDLVCEHAFKIAQKKYGQRKLRRRIQR